MFTVVMYCLLKITVYTIYYKIMTFCVFLRYGCCIVLLCNNCAFDKVK